MVKRGPTLPKSRKNRMNLVRTKGLKVGRRLKDISITVPVNEE